MGNYRAAHKVARRSKLMSLLAVVFGLVFIAIVILYVVGLVYLMNKIDTIPKTTNTDVYGIDG